MGQMAPVQLLFQESSGLSCLSSLLLLGNAQLILYTAQSVVSQQPAPKPQLPCNLCQPSQQSQLSDAVITVPVLASNIGHPATIRIPGNQQFYAAMETHPWNGHMVSHIPISVQWASYVSPCSLPHGIQGQTSPPCLHNRTVTATQK